MLTFFLGGFVRSVSRHKCKYPVPGPPAPPILYPEHARQRVAPDYHAAIVLQYQGAVHAA